MKFATDLDKEFYDNELKASGVDEVGFIKKRRELVKRLKDFRKSQDTKSSWRKNRWKLMKGIKRFHKSTDGKKFHRDLGRFLATRNLSGLKYHEAKTLILPLTSTLTHVFLETEYYLPLGEHVDYEVFSDEAYSEVLQALGKIRDMDADLSEHGEFLYRVCETVAIVKALADKHGKSTDEIEQIWKKAEGIVVKEYNLEKDDDGFYTLVVGVVKKMLGK